jgi:xylan 1,4-beta-xylosidase
MSIRYGRVLSAMAGVALSATLAAAETPAGNVPEIGKAARYINPLPLEALSKDGSPRGVNLGDVTVVKENGKYYLFGTGTAGALVSSDLLNWQAVPVEVKGGHMPVAPHVVKYNGAFYMSGNDVQLYKAKNILGPYELFGPWLDEKGNPWSGTANGKPWKGAFDVDIFVDDDNQPYLYYPARSTEGIYVVPLDKKRPNRFIAAPKHLFGFDPEHTWERWGERNEYLNNAWIEGPWVFKRNGTYYLEYSASGTQWTTYASGVYTAKSPTGPFTYASNNPLLRKTSGWLPDQAMARSFRDPTAIGGYSIPLCCPTRLPDGASEWTRWVSTRTAGCTFAK